MKREIKITSDGSTTFYLPELNEHFHSTHGAIQEAYHVYIKNGLQQITLNEISILEIGFGTGLNCFITLLETDKTIDYTGVEAYPITREEVTKVNYVSQLNATKHQKEFDEIHNVSWEEKHAITNKFHLTKRKQFFKDINDQNKFDLIYFDAFGPDIQPELWSEIIFKKMYKALKPNGILVTYAAKGDVKRNLKSVGFSLKRLPGPPGKWHMLKATKNNI